MTILSIAKSIAKNYNPEREKPPEISTRQNFLTPNIKPQEIYVYKSNRATLETNKGNLLDMSSMTVNTILGQNDPWIKANLIAYLSTDRPSFLSTRFGSEFYYKSAELIAQHSNVENPVVNHRQCNGSDVTELAILAAYTASHKPNKTLISFYGSYHGQNLTSYIVSDLQRHNLFLLNRQQANVTFLTPPQNTAAEDQILDNIHQLRQYAFGVILEPLQVNNNIYTFSSRFLKRLKKLCEEEGIALIFDEIQTAYGWLGKMTAAEYLEVKPNLITLSKGLTSGFGPLAAMVANKRYENIPYGTGEKTNGADIRSLIASKAVYERLLGIPESEIPVNLPDHLHQELRTGLLSTVPTKTKIINHYLHKIQKEFSPRDLKTTGLLLIQGLTFTDKEKTEKAYQMLMDHKIYVRKSAATLIIKPALTISDEELTFGLEQIHSVLKTIFPKKPKPQAKITIRNTIPSHATH